MWMHSTVAIHSYTPVIGLMVALYTVATLDHRGSRLVALALVFVPTGFVVAAEVSDASPQQALAALIASAPTRLAPTTARLGPGTRSS